MRIISRKILFFVTWFAYDELMDSYVIMKTHIYLSFWWQILMHIFLSRSSLSSKSSMTVIGLLMIRMMSLYPKLSWVYWTYHNFILHVDITRGGSSSITWGTYPSEQPTSFSWWKCTCLTFQFSKYLLCLWYCDCDHGPVFLCLIDII